MTFASVGHTLFFTNDSFIERGSLAGSRRGAERHGEQPSGDKKKAIRICFLSQKLPKLQFIKHILRSRESITESLVVGRLA